MYTNYKFVAIVLLYLYVSCVTAKNEIYEGNKVYRVEVRTKDDLESLKEIANRIDFDVWQPPFVGKREGMIMVTPETEEEFVEALRQADIEYELSISNVKEILDEEEKLLMRHRNSYNAGTRNLDYETYHRYEEIESYLVNISSRYPNLTTLESVGTSWHGRDLKILKISTTNFEDTSKPIVIIDSTIHAREWVTTPVTTYAINQLLEENAEPDLLNNIDWIIFPVVNPDGYEYTFTDNRAWRKTVSIHDLGGEECPGVDGNRNYNVSWNTVGVSANPCSNTYPGPTAFSEPEVYANGQILRQYAQRTELYITLHSHGNLMLYGWGDDGTLPANGLELHFVGVLMANAIDRLKLSTAPDYVVGNSNLVLYGTSGTGSDYGHFVGIPLVYTYELPGYGYTFYVPESYIRQIVTETWAGIMAGARYAIVSYPNRQR